MLLDSAQVEEPRRARKVTEGCRGTLTTTVNGVSFALSCDPTHSAPVASPPAQATYGVSSSLMPASRLYLLPPNPAVRSYRSRVPPIPSCASPKNAPCSDPESPPVLWKVLPLTEMV